MVTSQSGNSPLRRLVLFIICLAVVGSIVAGISCSVATQQQQMPAPGNFGSGDDLHNCRQTCVSLHCVAFVPGNPCDDGYAACLAKCV